MVILLIPVPSCLIWDFAVRRIESLAATILAARLIPPDVLLTVIVPVSDVISSSTVTVLNPRINTFEPT